MVYYFEWHSIPETFLSSSELPETFQFENGDELFVGKDSLQFMEKAYGIISGQVYDLRSPNKKIFIVANEGIFHLNIDVLTKIFSVLDTTNHSVVVDTKFLKLNDSLPGKKNLFNYFSTVIDLFNSMFNDRVQTFSSHEYEGYLINNYSVIDKHYTATTLESTKTFALIREAFKVSKKINNKKVYLTRRLVDKRGPYGDGLDVSNKDFTDFRMDDRMLNEEVLEEFFASKGFEIIAPEMFESVEDQVSFFGNVKTLVSVTSSGISNSIFMPEGSNVLELVTSFIVESHYNSPDGTPKAKLMEVLHNQYGPLAYLLDQNYARMPNFNRDPHDIINRIMNSSAMRGFLEIDDD